MNGNRNSTEIRLEVISKSEVITRFVFRHSLLPLMRSRLNKKIDKNIGKYRMPVRLG
jgi:hypothetical protein